MIGSSNLQSKHRSDQVFSLQDLLLLVEGSFGKAAHLDDLLVWPIPIFLDERQHPILSCRIVDDKERVDIFLRAVREHL